MTAPSTLRAPETSPPCPVCRYVGPVNERCPRCDWVLTGGPWAGHVTEAHQRAFDARLDAARRVVDLRAAVRAAGFPGALDRSVLDRVAPIVRGGPATAAELEEARVQLAAMQPPEPDVDDAVVAVLRTLVTGPAGGVLDVLDVSAEGIAAVRLRCGLDGVPHPDAPVRLQPWAQVFPVLPADPAAAGFRLAGGIGTGGPAPELDVDAAVAVATGAMPAEGPVLLIDRASRQLPLVTRLVMLVAERVRRSRRRVDAVRRAPGVGADGGLLDTLAALTPLRRAIGLVVVEVRGEVTRPLVHPLFPAGAWRAATLPAHVTVTGPAAGGQPAVLGVVAADPGAAPQHGRPLTVARVRMRPGAAHRLAVRLDGPDRVAVLEPVAAESGPADELLELVRRIPGIYRPPELDVDLAFLIELGGAEHELRRRVEVAESAIRWVEQRHPDPDAARYAVVGYGEHHHERPSASVTQSLRFASGPDALDFLGDLRVTPVIDAYHAPVEDALAEALGPLLGWRRSGTRRAVVLVGSRPPHPQSESEARCPRRLSWRRSKNGLVEHHVRLVTVWDPPPWCARDSIAARAARQTWADLGRNAAGGDPARVVAMAGGLPGAGDQQPLLFPIISTPAAPPGGSVR